MNLTFLSKTDLELSVIRSLKNSEGKDAVREIARRAKIGFCDGTIFNTAKAKVERESRVGTVIVRGGAR
jgi:hypothetical protein|tara:strand:+ start:151 stop:357 length:207 start_codon:yes stop_codon:yes gene_type:complete